MTDIQEMQAQMAKLVKRVDRIENTLKTVFLRLQTAKDFASFRGSTEYLFDGVMQQGEPE